MSLYLSRLTLSKTPSARALDAILNPVEDGLRLDAHHRLLWSVFTDGPDRTRDFLWREDRPGSFLTLSARPPIASDLFPAPEVKDFAPVLAPGDTLTFALRVNATRTVKSEQLAPNGKPKRKHLDVIMDRLRSVPGQTVLPPDQKSERPSVRMTLADEVGFDWLARQGEMSGFRLIAAEVQDYATVALPGYRGKRAGQPQFGILDMVGQLEVTDPANFVARLADGFGRAKAFGCGLMLIRRTG